MGLVTTLVVAQSLAVFSPSFSSHPSRQRAHWWSSEKWAVWPDEWEFEPNYPLDWMLARRWGIGWDEYFSNWNQWSGFGAGRSGVPGSPERLLPQWAEYGHPNNGNTMKVDQYRVVGRYGWPFFAVSGGYEGRNYHGQIGMHRLRGQPVGYFGEIPFLPDREGTNRFTNRVFIPMKPSLLGLVLDTVFFATLWKLFFIGLHKLSKRAERWKRERRLSMNRCSKCRYDLRGGPHDRCPECGEAVAHALTLVRG